MPTMPEEIPYLRDEIVEPKLVGGTITSSLVSEDGENFGFVVTHTDGRRFAVWVDMDAEGNGPGWLSVEDMPCQDESEGQHGGD